MYKHFAPKPVPASNRAQLHCRHQSWLKKRVQSKFDSQVQRKDSFNNAAAPVPGAVYYALDTEDPSYDYSFQDVTDTNSAKGKVAQEYAGTQSGSGYTTHPLPSYIYVLFYILV